MEGGDGGGGGGPSSWSMSSRRSLSMSNMFFSRRTDTNLAGNARRTTTSDRTVKRLRLSKALTIPQNTSIQEACRRMITRKVNAVLLTDSNALLCGILTDKDLATRVIAQSLNLEETPVSRVMTKNPVFVLSDTLAVEALQKMVHGKFRHLPVVENGEVIALLDIAKCLFDAIARMERAAEKGKAIAAAVEGIEKHWGTSISGPGTFLETLRDQIFRPSLDSIFSENSRIVKVSPSDSVLTATKKMHELQLGAAVIVVEDKLQGILTSRDILMRVVAQNLPPDTTEVDKVMTPNPRCGSVDTPIVNALHIMQDGKFLHLPVLDRDGNIVSIVDVIHVTHAAVATVGSNCDFGTGVTSSLVQKFWDSAMESGQADEEDDSKSEASLKFPSEAAETGRSSPNLPNTFSFKLEDRNGQMHRFNCDTRSMTGLITSILQRVGEEIDRNRLPQILYEDEDHDKVLLASDGDLEAAIEHAMLAGWKGLRLHLEYSESSGRSNRSGSGSLEFAQADAWAAAYSTVAAGAALVAGLGVMAYLRRSGF